MFDPTNVLLINSNPSVPLNELMETVIGKDGAKYRPVFRPRLKTTGSDVQTEPWRTDGVLPNAWISGAAGLQTSLDGAAKITPYGILWFSGSNFFLTDLETMKVKAKSMDFGAAVFKFCVYKNFLYIYNNGAFYKFDLTSDLSAPLATNIIALMPLCMQANQNGLYFLDSRSSNRITRLHPDTLAEQATSPATLTYAYDYTNTYNGFGLCANGTQIAVFGSAGFGNAAYMGIVYLDALTLTQVRYTMAQQNTSVNTCTISAARVFFGRNAAFILTYRIGYSATAGTASHYWTDVICIPYSWGYPSTNSTQAAAVNSDNNFLYYGSTQPSKWALWSSPTNVNYSSPAANLQYFREDENGDVYLSFLWSSATLVEKLKFKYFPQDTTTNYVLNFARQFAIGQNTNQQISQFLASERFGGWWPDFKTVSPINADIYTGSVRRTNAPGGGNPITVAEDLDIYTGALNALNIAGVLGSFGDSLYMYSNNNSGTIYLVRCRLRYDIDGYERVEETDDELLPDELDTDEPDENDENGSDTSDGEEIAQ